MTSEKLAENNVYFIEQRTLSNRISPSSAKSFRKVTTQDTVVKKCQIVFTEFNLIIMNHFALFGNCRKLFK